jgi:LmbE family N-acetylglucosaminyl deacetylase
MVLAPHADDESLGCGGLIAELVAKARPPMIVILRDGTGSHPLSREIPGSAPARPA